MPQVRDEKTGRYISAGGSSVGGAASTNSRIQKAKAVANPVSPEYTWSDHIAAREYWTKTDGYDAIRKGEGGEAEKHRGALEDYIEKTSKHTPVTSKITRGVSMSDEDLAGLKVGDIANMKGISSFTTRTGIAQSFARNTISETKPNKVVFQMPKGSKYAAKLGKFPGKQYDEGEVLMSGKAKLKIASIKKDSWGYTVVSLVDD